jgi:hypothetical protein
MSPVVRYAIDRSTAVRGAGRLTSVGTGGFTPARKDGILVRQPEIGACPAATDRGASTEQECVMRETSCRVLLTVLLSWSSAEAAGSTRYISPPGTDSRPPGNPAGVDIGDCRNAQGPCASLEYVSDLIASGDTLLCRGGVYTAAGDWCFLEQVSDVVIMNFPGERPVFQTAGQLGVPEGSFFTIHGVSNITIQGIEVRPPATTSASSCFRIIDASNVTIRQVVAEGQKYSATHYTWRWIVNASETANLEVTGCELGGAGEFDNFGSSGWIVLLQQDCSYGYVHENKLGKGVHSVVAIYSGSHHNIVRDNEIRYAIGYGVDTGPGTYDNLIEFNSCQGSDRDLDYVKSPLLINGDRNIVRYNTGWDSEKHGIALVGGFDNRIYNNVFYGNGSNGLLASTLSGNPDTWGGIRVVNNVFTANMQTAPRNQHYAELGFFQAWLDRNDGFQRNYMVLDGRSDDPRAAFIEGQGFERASWIQANYANWRDNIFEPGNLLFKDPQRGDFRVTHALSMLVDAGAFLARATNDGTNSRDLQVDDPYVFFADSLSFAHSWHDGIVIGQGRQVHRIRHVDHTTRTLRLESPATWVQGQTVTLPFVGRGPDIGASEFSFPVDDRAAVVPLTYQTATPPGGHGELGTPAVWVSADAAGSLLFVTDKTMNRVEIHDPIGNYYLGILGSTAAGPDQLRGPNGVTVAYSVPTVVGPRDVLFVVESDNHRVSMFLPPGFYLGAFGDADLDRPVNVSLHWENGRPQAWVTDAGSSPQRIVVFDIVPTPVGLAGTLRHAFAVPSNSVLESIVVDAVTGRVLVCDSNARDVMIFDLDGNFLERFGAGRFTGTPKGLAIFDAGNGGGYVIVTDQGALPLVEWEVFDRRGYRFLGQFNGATVGTCDITLVQKALPGFPFGSLFAVNSGKSVHAYSWAAISAATGLCLEAPCATVDAAIPSPTSTPRIGSFPSPFGGSGTLHFRLDSPAAVDIAVFDPRGARVAVLARSVWSAGEHAIDWDGRGENGRQLPAGVYFVRARLGSTTSSHKITLLR